MGGEGLVPIVIPIIAGIIVGAGTLVGVTISVTLATMIAWGLVLGAAIAASMLLAPKGNKSLSQGQELDVKLDPTMPRQIVVGQTATGGSVIWAFTYTDDSTPNKYLVRVIELSDYPCSGFVNVMEGSNIYGQLPNILSFDGDITTGWHNCQQHLGAGGAYKMMARLYLGTLPTQAKGSITLIANPQPGNTVTIGGSAITFVSSGASGSAQVNIGANLAATALALTYVVAAYETIYGVRPVNVPGTGQVNLSAMAAGTPGNAVHLATSNPGAITLSGATLTGGGNDAVADANLINWSGGQWTSNHKGSGICYCAMRYTYNTDAFPNGEPQLQWILQGAKIYDQRQDATRTNPTRTGSQRLTDPNSWAYSENSAVVAQQVMRGFYVNGVQIFGAAAQDIDLPDPMLLAAYNTCDILVPLPVGGSEKQYRCGIMLTASENVSQDLLELQSSMDGNIYDRSGIITILPGGSRTPLFTLTDQDVVWTEESSWQTLASLDTLYNSVTGSYIPQSQAYVETPFPVLRNTAWETDDGSQCIPRNITYRAVTSDTQVQRINKRVHAGSRFQGTIGFVTNLNGLQMEQGDWFQFTSARWGFAGKYFVCTQDTLLQTLRLGFIGSEISPNIDGWVPAIDYKTPTDTVRGQTLPILYPGVPPSNTVSSSDGSNLITDINFTDPFYWTLS
jgi:hypothetical protein